MFYFLPRECPRCERIISPATEPSVGDISICPLCDAALIYIEGLLLRIATLPELRNAQIPAAESEA